jgi:hypothetical protein
MTRPSGWCCSAPPSSSASGRQSMGFERIQPSVFTMAGAPKEMPSKLTALATAFGELSPRLPNGHHRRADALGCFRLSACGGLRQIRTIRQLRHRQAHRAPPFSACRAGCLEPYPNAAQEHDNHAEPNRDHANGGDIHLDPWGWITPI